MVDHRKRAERRRAYYESRVNIQWFQYIYMRVFTSINNTKNQIGDPRQLIRVIGSSTKLYPDAEQFYYHENPENLYVITWIETFFFCMQTKCKLLVCHGKQIQTSKLIGNKFEIVENKMMFLIKKFDLVLMVDHC